MSQQKKSFQFHFQEMALRDHASVFLKTIVKQGLTASHVLEIVNMKIRNQNTHESIQNN